MCLHVSADWKERAAGVVCARMSHQALGTQPEKKRRRRRGKPRMSLCATEVKVSGLPTSLDQKGEDRSWRWAAAAALGCWHTFGACVSAQKKRRESRFRRDLFAPFPDH